MSTHPKTILIVDDDPDLRTALAGLLREAGWEVMEGKNGDEAVSLAAFHHPDVILMDVMMPVKDGFAAYKELREDHRTAHIPVVMLTAVNEHELGMKPRCAVHGPPSWRRAAPGIYRKADRSKSSSQYIDGYTRGIIPRSPCVAVGAHTNPGGKKTYCITQST